MNIEKEVEKFNCAANAKFVSLSKEPDLERNMAEKSCLFLHNDVLGIVYHPSFVSEGGLQRPLNHKEAAKLPVR